MASRTLYRSLARQYLHSRPQSFYPTSASSFRPFSNTSPRAYPRKDSQDKDSINTDATEYSKSGTDDTSAQQEKAAFDPSTTDPEKEKDIAGEGQGEGNPLEFSPANRDISKQRGETEGGAENSGKE